MSLSIIGCVVNGPGEALMTDLGFTGGGKGSGMVYMAGKPDHKQSNDGMIDHIVELVDQASAHRPALGRRDAGASRRWTAGSSLAPSGPITHVRTHHQGRPDQGRGLRLPAATGWSA
jgi:hypothetical protein